MKTIKLRKKIKNVCWLVKKLYKYGEKEKCWETFYTFECSAFFRGKIIAKMNKKIYYNNMYQIEKRICQLKYFIKKIDCDYFKLDI